MYFTSSYQTLKSIVESSYLKLFYCKEDFYSVAKAVSRAVHPMVCFSEYNGKFRIKNFDFKRENEWRYVPTKKQIENNLISQSISKYLKRKAFYNNKLENFSLLFTKDDIKHIFRSQ